MSEQDWKVVREWAEVHAEDCPAWEARRGACLCGTKPALAALERLEAEAKCEHGHPREYCAQTFNEMMDRAHAAEAERDAAMQQATKTDARAAAMREVLEFAERQWGAVDGFGDSPMKRALATNAGAALLERLREAEERFSTWEGTANEASARAEKAEAERDALRVKVSLDAQTMLARAEEEARLENEVRTLRAEVERLRKHDAQRREQVTRLQDTLERLQAGRSEHPAPEALTQARREERERLMPEVRKLQSLCLKVLAQWVRMADGEDADEQRGLVAKGRQDFDAIAAAIRALGDA